MKENMLKIISTLVVIFLLAYSIMSFINSSKTNDPNHTSLGSGIVYLFALIALAYITFIA